MVRCFFIQAIASLGCWTDIQTVHVRVSKPWAVAARQQFDASKTKHMRFLQEARSPLFFREIESCLIMYIDSWLMFLHPKHQFSISFNFFRWSWYGLVFYHWCPSNQGTRSWDGAKISETQLWTEFGRRMPWDGCCCDGHTPVSGV